MRRIAFAVASAWVLSAGWAILSASGAQSSPAPAPATANASLNPRAVVDRYCVTCHNQRTKTSDLALDGVDITTPPAHGEIWENVVRRLRTRSMPPQGMPRPDDATYEALATYLETELVYQKTRAAFVADRAKGAVVYGAIAAALAVLALIGLTVGLIIALAPLLTAWGSSAVVVGALLLGAFVFVRLASKRWSSLMQAIEASAEREP